MTGFGMVLMVNTRYCCHVFIANPKALELQAHSNLLPYVPAEVFLAECGPYLGPRIQRILH